MNEVIYKYQLPIRDISQLTIPKSAKVLSVGYQGQPHDCLQVWAIIDPGEEHHNRGFRIAGTGHPLGIEGRFVGTVTALPMGLVFHVFEEPHDDRND